MKKHLAALAIAALPFAASAAPEHYTVDPFHAQPMFAVEHLGISMTHGQLGKTTGRITLDRAARTGAVELSIETASLYSGDNEKAGRPRSRDEHLRAADFFNVAEFPRVTFKSTSVAFSGDQPSKIEGNLTLLGVTKPVTLVVDRFKCGTDPFTKKGLCGASVSGKIKRSDFGMKAMLQYVGDEVALNISLEGFKD